MVGGSYLIKPSRANGLCSQVQHNSAAPIGLTFDLLEGGAKCDWSLLQPCDSFTALSFVLILTGRAAVLPGGGGVHLGVPSSNELQSLQV